MDAISQKQAQELERRFLDPELVVSMGGRSVVRHGSEMLALPFIRDGKVVNHKYRTITGEKRFEQDADAVKCVWNEDCLRDPSLSALPLIITEGEFDALAIIQSGHPRTISVPDGAPAKELGGATDIVKYSYVDAVLRLLPPTAVIILATDNDGPGQNLMNDLVIRLGASRCKFITYPLKRGSKDRHKDMLDVLGEYGPSGVLKTIERAAWHTRPGVYSMSELPEEPDREKYSLHMGPTVDSHIILRRGDFWVITGIPGHGKSSFADDMICRLALNNNLRTCVGSFEKNPKTDHRRDFRKWFISTERGGATEAKWTREEVERADEFIERSFRFVVPSHEDSASLEWLVDQFTAAVVQLGCDVLMVDPWNEIEHARPMDMTLTEYVGAAIKTLKRLAKRFNVAVIVVAHPTKLNPRDELTLHSISDSAHWSNKCDVGIIVERDFETSEVKFRIPKVRNDDIGKAGEIKMYFDRPARRFSVLGDPVR